MKRKQLQHHGFTIVELLVVIVVLGVLAAIVLAAVNGAQRSARNHQNASLAAAWRKGLTAYALANGNSYPSEVMDTSNDFFYCIGSYPDVDGDGYGDCKYSGTSQIISSSNSIGPNAKMRPYVDVNALAAVAVPYDDGGNTYSRGAMLWLLRNGTLDGTPHSWFLAYTIEAPATCPYRRAAAITTRPNFTGNAPAGYTSQSGGSRWCVIPLPNPARL